LVMTNGLKICSIMLSGIPQPVSETEPPPWTDQGPEPRVPRQHPWSERVLAQVWVLPKQDFAWGQRLLSLWASHDYVMWHKVAAP